MAQIRKLALAMSTFGATMVAPISAQAQSVAPDVKQVITPQQRVPPQLPPVVPQPQLPPLVAQPPFKVIPAPLPQFPVVKPQPGSPADFLVPVPDQIENSDALDKPRQPALKDSQSPQVSFDGPSGSNLEPPDASVAVGPNDLILATNGGIQTYDKTGTTLTVPTDPSTFFMVPSDYNIQSDPKFVYDAPSGRFFGVWIGYSSTTGTGSWFLAVSTSSSASGSYNVYTISESNQLPDYPGLGVCDHKVVLTANNFLGGSGAFSGAVAVALNKDQLTAGDPVVTNFFNNIQLSSGDAAFTVQPTQSLSPTCTCNLVSLSGNTGIQLYQITGVPNDYSEATLTTGAVVPLTNPVSTPPNAPQPSTTNLLDTGDTRLLGASYRSDNGGSIWTTSTTGCNVSDLMQSCANLVEIQGVDDTPNLKRQVIYGGPNLFYYYPALITDSSNNGATVFSRSGSSEFPGLRYGICPAASPSCNSSLPLVAGNTFYLGSRWGDFFGAALDPSDNSTIWLYGEYKGTSSSLWQTFTSTVVPSSTSTIIP